MILPQANLRTPDQPNPNEKTKNLCGQRPPHPNPPRARGRKMKPPCAVNSPQRTQRLVSVPAPLPFVPAPGAPLSPPPRRPFVPSPAARGRVRVGATPPHGGGLGWGPPRARGEGQGGGPPPPHGGGLGWGSPAHGGRARVGVPPPHGGGGLAPKLLKPPAFWSGASLLERGCGLLEHKGLCGP